ncbi:MAG: hypothetical protein COV29_03695 [Candidatus Yanofskybacteria bacterium CG10_big_fil_rev_8_21_14_0_10_36_16]|uniref:Uncharacterized protein n=1 Tax=Candidatus Yanofskybacteria bacterium CG10_big_fil_rev_8_21_14_0_10_36_16 TaxID=1975096 RepID=A0A2J0QA69_9BACT|nr:MAG: hypothetical protein COV29_03695 [Candidatus Yanofskybacteria bacterium CG10_big_fil_rev_8_21_14_0_10_36_16]
MVTHKEKIVIKNREPFDDEDGWQFLVKLGKFEFIIDVDREYWMDLTEEKMTPEELVQESFRFLLEREPKESILSQFNLQTIQRYFPEYENTIKVAIT